MTRARHALTVLTFTAALAACSSADQAPEQSATPSGDVRFESAALTSLFGKGVSLGDALNWRASGWLGGGKSSRQVWCTGGSAPTACASASDADGTKAEEVYVVTAELKGEAAASGGIAVRVEYAAKDGTTVSYRETAYASAEQAGFTATVKVDDGKPEKVPGDHLLRITQTPSYQPTYVDEAGARHEMGQAIQVGSTMAPREQLRAYTADPGSLRSAFVGRLDDVAAEARKKLRYTNTGAGVCALDNQPNCPATQLNKQQRASAVADLDDWHRVQRDLMRKQAKDIHKRLTTPVSWASLVADGPTTKPAR